MALAMAATMEPTEPKRLMVSATRFLGQLLLGRPRLSHDEVAKLIKYFSSPLRWAAENVAAVRPKAQPIVVAALTLARWRFGDSDQLDSLVAMLNGHQEKHTGVELLHAYIDVRFSRDRYQYGYARNDSTWTSFLKVARALRAVFENESSLGNLCAADPDKVVNWYLGQPREAIVAAAGLDQEDDS